MADDNTIIEGMVKFRDGKKWKARWCVLRKLSPVADCLQVELYREAAGAAAAGAAGALRRGSAVAALALQRVAALEAGFTLDKQSHTLAALAADLVLVLALPSREALLQWQVKIESVVGSGRQFPVAIVSGAAGAAGAGAAGGAGAARLHVRAARAALVAGCPPALLRDWPLQHLRRFGVVDGRLVLEGGALCTTGAAGPGGGDAGGGGVVALAGARVELLERELRAAAAALAARTPELGSPMFPRFGRPDTRQSEICTIARSHTAGDALSGAGDGRWGAAGDARWPAEDEAGCPATAASTGLQRCVSCMSSLGALAGAGPPGARPAGMTPRPFQPAWWMCAPAPVAAPVTAPPRPPKPTSLDFAGPAGCWPGPHSIDDVLSRIGPYDNYDVPRLHSFELEGELYDTPRRLQAAGVPRSRTVDLAGAGAAAGYACRCPVGRAAGLYASVDLSRKARRRQPAAPPPGAPQYENLAFAASLQHYENAGELARRAQPAAGDYLVMCPAGAGAGYARMSPRAASSPALAAGSPATGRRRAASVDSSRAGAGSRESMSSTETLREVAPGAARGPVRRRAPAAGGTRDSSSSNDSGVSSWSGRAPAASGRRRARSSEPPAGAGPAATHKSRSAEAEVPVLNPRPPRGVCDAHSTSSGASDLSDYIDTLSLCSSHSSSDAPVTMRSRGAGCAACAGAGGAGGAGGAARECAAVLRPRSGAEYRRLLPAPRPAM